MAMPADRHQARESLPQPAIVAVPARLAGVVAAMGPARRAAHLDVLRAISRH